MPGNRSTASGRTQLGRPAIVAPAHGPTACQHGSGALASGPSYARRYPGQGAHATDGDNTTRQPRAQADGKGRPPPGDHFGCASRTDAHACTRTSACACSCTYTHANARRPSRGCQRHANAA